MRAFIQKLAVNQGNVVSKEVCFFPLVFRL